MKKRRRLLLIVLVAVVLPLVGVGAHLHIPPKPGVTRENFRRLHRWMTLQRVEDILGSKASSKLPMMDHSLYVWRNSDGEGCQLHVFQVDEAMGKIISLGDFVDKDGKPIESLADEPEPVLEMARRRVKEWTGW